MDANLLDPISEPLPCGRDMSFSPEFDAIQEMRREDDPSLDQGAWVTSLKVADWKGVEALAAKLLQTQTKDLRLAMWWCDAAARNRGYAGLAEGLELGAQLCERYWLEMHPLDEDGEWDQRIGNLGWLLQRVSYLAQLLPVTQAAAGSFTLVDLASARALQTQIDKHPDEAERLADDRITLERYMRALRDTAKPWLLETLAAARRCETALDRLQQIVDNRLGDAGPSFSAAREALSSAVHDIERLAKEAGAVVTPTPAYSLAVAGGAATAEGEVAQLAASTAGAGGPIRSRAQALLQLREVADYFRRTEPHSPVAYLADKAAHWGEMPLHQWLRTVLKDPGALSHVEELLGLDAANPDTPA
ncbi:type VI secretion system protein TssA [Schlegelella sp. S2-27]|uniref:Type VI secretion system protein TssA n=1 Tax=Caldimonas mangrovi TaxID=2944811 RepID=A0ABT0YM60_9BURK|nr:type VI secretion system protein TssA [Caldimonas mangrovi]MCM5679800.1 type VI secretion system protein TssA [Caldimonas mangrovi]